MCIMLGKRKKGRRLLVKSIEVLKSNMKDECISIGDLVVEKDYIQVVFNYYIFIYVLICVKID